MQGFAGVALFFHCSNFELEHDTNISVYSCYLLTDSLR